MPMTPDCPRCGATLPTGARFCPSCGTKADAAAPRAFSYESVEPRYFGVAPATSVLVLGLVSFGVGIAVLATGGAIAGSLLTIAGIALFGAFLGLAHRKPDGALARLALTAERGLRSHASRAAGVLAARSAAQLEVLRLRHQAASLQAARARALLELGDAAYAQDKTRTRHAREAVERVDEELAAGEARLAEALADAATRVRRVRIETDSTELLEPQPPQVPEPTPEPHVPPTPPEIPEPSPEPHVPPVPPQIPEPTPTPDPGTPAARKPVYTR
jgi:hypothetical protein